MRKSRLTELNDVYKITKLITNRITDRIGSKKQVSLLPAYVSYITEYNKIYLN